MSHDDRKMWAVHLQGPDDVHAAPDRAVADAVVLLLNRQYRRAGLPMHAVVIEWPHGYETWSAGKDQLELEVIGGMPSSENQ